MNIALLQRYHYVFYVDATYQTNHEGYRLFNIVSSTATRRTFIVAQALIRDETTATVQWVMTELKTLLRRVGVPEQEEFVTLQHPNFDPETGAHRVSGAAAASDVPDAAVNRISNSSMTDAEIMSLLAYQPDPNVPECYLNFYESHLSLPKPHEALRLVNAVPSVIVCDRSLANINAIRTIFILVTLRLCVWLAQHPAICSSSGGETTNTI